MTMLKSRHSFKRTFPVAYKCPDCQDTETSLHSYLQFNGSVDPWAHDRPQTSCMWSALCIVWFSRQYSFAGFITYAVGLLLSKPYPFYTEQHNFTHGYIFEQIEIFYVNGLHTEIPKYMQKFYFEILLKNTLVSSPKHQQGFYLGHPWAWVMSKSEQEKQVLYVTKGINMCGQNKARSCPQKHWFFPFSQDTKNLSYMTPPSLILLI